VTAPIDALLSFMLGGAIALACRVQLRLSPRPWYATRYFAALVGFNAMLVAPAAVYRYFFHPDWSAMYLVDASSFPALFGLGALVAVVGSGVGAFVLGAHCARAHREWLLLTTLAVAAAGIAVVAAVGYHRIRVVGSFEQWQGSFGLRPLLETELFVALALMGGCMLAGWLHVLIVFAFEGAAVRSASH
jgi:hypothetical protein